MNLDTFLATITDSAPHDWEKIDTSRGVYRAELMSSSDPKGRYIEVQQIDWLACFKPDIDISIGTGIPSNTDFREPWAAIPASSGYLDFFYRGALIYRETLVHVDGGRASLPLPNRETLGVAAGARQRARLMAAINGNVERFEDYFHRAGLKLAFPPGHPVPAAFSVKS